MEIKTKFNRGDTVYAVRREYKWDDWCVAGPMVIGKIIAEITDTEQLESYMCVETGIEFGNIYFPDMLFSSKHDAELSKQLKNRGQQ